MRRHFLVLAAVVLLAAQASAVGWFRQGESNQPTSEATSDGMYRCLPTSNSDDCEIIDVSDCDAIDVGLTGDLNGDTTSATLFTATAQWCPVNRSDATVNTNAERDAACVDYSSGTLTADGTLQGLGVPSGYFRINVGGTFAADPAIFLKCNP